MTQGDPPRVSTRSDAWAGLMLWEIRALTAVLVTAAVVEDLAGWWTRRAQMMLEMSCASWAPMTPLLENCGRHQIIMDIRAVL